MNTSSIGPSSNNDLKAVVIETSANGKKVRGGLYTSTLYEKYPHNNKIFVLIPQMFKKG